MLEDFSYRDLGVGSASRNGNWWGEDFCFLSWHRRIWKHWEVECIWWQVMWMSLRYFIVLWWVNIDSPFGFLFCRIFALATVLSSVLVYNLPETVCYFALELFPLAFCFAYISPLYHWCVLDDICAKYECSFKIFSKVGKIESATRSYVGPLKHFSFLCMLLEYYINFCF